MVHPSWSVINNEFISLHLILIKARNDQGDLNYPARSLKTCGLDNIDLAAPTSFPRSCMTNYILRTKITSITSTLFWCFSLSQIEDLCQYLEGPVSTWKDHGRNIGVNKNKYIPIVGSRGTDWF